MAPNARAILLVILYSWTHALPSSKASSSNSIYNKANVIFSTSRCCRPEKSQSKSHKRCWCTTETQDSNDSEKQYGGRLFQLENFKTLESMLQWRSSRRYKDNDLDLSTKLDGDIKHSSHDNKSRVSDNSRNRTLELIFRRISSQLLSELHQNRSSPRVFPLPKREISTIPEKKSNSTQKFSSIGVLFAKQKQNQKPLLKKSWNRSYSQNVFVFGRDDRTQITSSLLRKFPYSNIVRLSTGCTGTLITPFHVLTAAHCVHNGREFLNKLEMMKVEVPDPIGVRVYYIEKIGIPDRWLNPRSRNYQQASFDYAVVRLSYGVHGRYQFLPLSVPSESTLHQNLQFLGFPNYGYGLWRSVCPARTTKSFMDRNLILARCDSAIGNSGAAIFTADFRSEKRVVGVLSSTVSMGDNPLYQRYSVITALTETKLLDICTEIGTIGVFYGVCPSPESITIRRQGFQRKIKTIPFFG